MRDIRPVAPGVVAAVFLATGMMVGGALAQTPNDEKPGKRVLLLQIFEAGTPKAATDKRLTTVQAVVARKPVSRGKIAASAPPIATNSPARTQIAYSPAPGDAPSEVLPAADTAAPPMPAQPPAPASVEKFGSPVAGGRAIRVISSGTVNEAQLPGAGPLPRANGTAPSDVTETKPPHDIAVVKSDFAELAAAHKQRDDLGDTSGIVQVLAALGGAVAAGSIGWLLIWSTPRRAFG
jgi:hypothetical protein